MNLYTSDLHFGHSNVINFDHRPFLDREEMDRILIKLWNSRVQSDDNVYILGDFCFRCDKPADWYLRQLKGHKILIQGNHDQAVMENPAALKLLEGVEKMMHVKDGEHNICLCHFPIAEWNGFYKGSWHIYGHIHNKKNETYDFMKTRERALNAGCMINNFTPASMNELKRNNEIFKEEELKAAE